MMGAVADGVIRITGNQRLQLAEAIFDAFRDWNAFDSLVRNGLGEQPNRVAGRENVRAAIDQLIEWCDSRSELGKLINTARTLNLTNEMLAAAAEDIARTSAGAGGLQTPLIRGNNPVLDRDTLRQTIDNMITTNGGSVLAVQGRPGSGKTYSASFISHVVDQRRIRIASIDLVDYAGLDVGDLSETIAYQIGRSDSLNTIPQCPGTDQMARWVLKLSNWIIGQIRGLVEKTSIDKVWIILDGFGAVRRNEIDESFRDLALRLVAQSQSIPELVVILIDYPDVIPKIESHIYRDDIPPPTQADVRRVYEAVIRQSGRTMEATLLDALVDATWREAEPADPNDREWLGRLGQAVKKRVTGLRK